MTFDIKDGVYFLFFGFARVRLITLRLAPETIKSGFIGVGIIILLLVKLLKLLQQPYLYLCA